MTLRARVRVLIVIIAISGAVLLALSLFIGDEWVEDAAIADLLMAELDRFQGASSPPDRAFMVDTPLQYLRPSQGSVLPASVAALAPGVHQDVMLEESPYWVLVRQIAVHDRAYVIYSASRIEVREHRLWLLATLAGAVLVLLAWLYSRRMADYALQPFDALVRQIEAIDPTRRGQRVQTVDADAELDTIVRSLNQHLQRVDSLVDHERAFSSATSHELRGPLSVIQGSAEMLSASALPAQQSSAARLMRAIYQVNEILDALLALTRRDDVATVVSLSLPAWLQEAAESHRREGTDVDIRWNTEALILMANPGAARVVFTNLFRNALAVSQGGEVVVTVTPEGVTIEDSGPGIPSDALAKIFDPGFRLRDGGSGMGLYIAKVVAERNGWSVQINNREGGGARAQWRFVP